MKTERHRRILALIDAEPIGTQEQLSRRLAETYMAVTQATISRDIRALHLHKAPDPETGVVRYVAPAAAEAFSARLSAIFRDSVVSCASAQNLVIIKTLAGMAGAAAAAVDAAFHEDIVGTLAGDDTVFIAMKNNQAAKAYTDEINQTL